MNDSVVSQRIGVLGGTFDPIHLAHVELAKYAIEQCRLNKLIVVPCSQPPHRGQAKASASQRLNMLYLAFEDLGNTEFCEYELNKPSASYTVETLEFLADRYPNAQLVFCLGGDSLRDFTQWHRWQDILSIAHLAVMRRQNQNEVSEYSSDAWGKLFLERRIKKIQNMTKDAGQIIQIVASGTPISATLIREHIRLCASKPNQQFKQNPVLSAWLNPKVFDYIVENKVYQ